MSDSNITDISTDDPNEEVAQFQIISTPLGCVEYYADTEGGVFHGNLPATDTTEVLKPSLISFRQASTVEYIKKGPMVIATDPVTKEEIYFYIWMNSQVDIYYQYDTVKEIMKRWITHWHFADPILKLATVDGQISSQLNVYINIQ